MYHCKRVLSSLSRLIHTTTAEKDENTKLQLIGHPSGFLTIYGKPVYVVEGMSRQPVSLLRFGYPEGEAVAFTDDDFIYYNNVTAEFQELKEGPYSIFLKYTGLRWLGKSKASFGCLTKMR